MPAAAFLGKPVNDATNSFGRLSDSAAAADALADWLCHRIGTCFATRVRPDATE